MQYKKKVEVKNNVKQSNRSVRAEEISAKGTSIFKHDPNGKVADAYRVLTKEVLANAEKRRKHQLEASR